MLWLLSVLFLCCGCCVVVLFVGCRFIVDCCVMLLLICCWVVVLVDLLLLKCKCNAKSLVLQVFCVFPTTFTMPSCHPPASTRHGKGFTKAATKQQQHNNETINHKKQQQEQQQQELTRQRNNNNNNNRHMTRCIGKEGWPAFLSSTP